MALQFLAGCGSHQFSEDQFVNPIDANELWKRFEVKFNTTDTNVITQKLKKILIDVNKIEPFFNELGYSVSQAVSLMVIGRFDVILEPRVIPRLKHFFEINKHARRYDESIKINSVY